MASILIQVSKTHNVSPLDYFDKNESALKLATDSYKTINMLRPKGNRVGLTKPIDNTRTAPGKLIRQ